jgi:hypothetical protein
MAQPISGNKAFAFAVNKNGGRKQLKPSRALSEQYADQPEGVATRWRSNA